MSLAGTHSIDLATGQPGMTIGQLESFLEEMRVAPAWRFRADMECDYYDNNQHTPEEIAIAESRGLPIVTANLIFPTINMILGMEAKTRTDWKVLPDGPNTSEDFADALTVQLTEAERVTNSDRACADAYAKMMKAGLGWVHPHFNMDPFGYPHIVEEIDRREIWWDMRGKKLDTSDWRWLIRRKWHDADYLYALFPKTIGGRNIHELIDAATNATASWDYANFSASIPMMQDGLIDRDIRSWEYDNWRDTDRRRAMLYETWYRMYVRGYVMTMPDGRVVEYDERNLIHQAIIAQGVALPVSAIYSKVRLAWWLGPFRLYDVPSPFAHNMFPYIPFWAYREDRTGVPFGEIRVMISQQDEINARRAKMLWQLSANRITTRESAFKDHDRVRTEANRPDAYLSVQDTPENKNRALKDIILIEEHAGLNAQQMSVYQDAKQTIQQVVGVYGPMLGDAKSGADAGVAIDMLIQQGNTTLAEPNDNYRMARTLVGEQLLSNIAQKMAGKPQDVKLDKRHPRRPGQRITLNQPAKTDQGLPFTQNDVMRLKTRVALADVAPSPTYQQQEFSEISKVIAGLPDEAKPQVLDMWVEASSSPRKHEIADRLRKLYGIAGPAPDPMTMDPEQLAAAKAEQVANQQQAMRQAQSEELMNRAAVSEIGLTMAQTKLAEAAAIEKLTKSGKIKGRVVDVIKTDEMQGVATVELETPEPPKPTIGAKGKGRDSTTLQRSS